MKFNRFDFSFLSLRLVTIPIFKELSVNVMEAMYLDSRSMHGCMWPVERKRETGMAASSTIISVERSQTSESQFALMQILARPYERKNTWWRQERVILSEWVNRWARSKVSTWRREGRTDRRKEGKAHDTRNRSARVNTPKPWETN